MIGLMVVLLKFFCDGEYGFSTVEVGDILGNGCGIQGKNYIALLQESEISETTARAIFAWIKVRWMKFFKFPGQWNFKKRKMVLEKGIYLNLSNQPASVKITDLKKYPET